MSTVAPPEPRLFREEDLVAEEAASFACGGAFVYTRRCPDRTGPNEDAAALIPHGSGDGLLVVADGVGGMRGGSQASGLTISRLATAVHSAWETERDLRNAVLDGVEAANTAVTELGGAGSTLAVAEIQGRAVRPYHIGDASILVVGQRGRIKLQTVSHSPTGYAVEAGLLDGVEALHHEERHLISNMLGTPDMRIEVGSAIALADRDTVLLASDGLSDNLTTEEIIETIRKGPLEAAGRKLAALCGQRMDGEGGNTPSKPDDLTFILFRLQPGNRRQVGNRRAGAA
ncbi:MAG: serine/threonine protein phosphatase [Planctomycetes bacterium]|nr:serine/threonine protein phosphatase [Planctomycetota bacterium]